MMLKALIFDMDGVLVDSMPYHAEAWKIVLGEMNIYIEHQDIYDIEGSNHEGVIRLMFQKAGKKPPKNFRELANKKREIFERINKIRPFYEIKEILPALKKRLKLGVVSGSDRKIVESILNNFFPDIFDVVVTGDDVIQGKPSPEPYLKAIEMLRLNKNECIVIENSPFGVESAKRAGVYCIAIPTYVKKHRLEQADMVLDNHTSLRKYLSIVHENC